MRRVSIFALVVLLLLTATLTPVAAADEIELQMTWWGSQNRHDRTIKVIDQYMKENPNIKITYEFAAFGDYWTKLNTKAAGSELPCIMQQDYAYLAEWSKRDLLMPLDDFFKDKTIDVSNVAESVLDSGKVDDKAYGLSLGSNSQSIIIDVDAFKKAGIELPALDWSWKDFEDTAMKLHEKLGIWALSTGLEDVQLWKSLYLAHGMHIFSDDGTKLGYEDDQPLIDHFNMILRLQKAGAIATQEEAAQFTNQTMEQSPLVTGKEAMRYQWSNQVVAIFTAAGKDRHFILHPLPRPEGKGPENYLKPSMFFSIPASCANAKEAAKFINYFTNSEEANKELAGERGVPISSVIRESMLPQLDAVGKETFKFLETVEKDSSPIFPPDPAGFSDILNNVYVPEFVQPVLYEQVSVEEGVAALRKGAEEILAKNK
jgi:multiple sugar transport system substrate-binding protein